MAQCCSVLLARSNHRFGCRSFNSFRCETGKITTKTQRARRKPEKYLCVLRVLALIEGLLPGWRTNNGYLGWLDESDQFVYAVINGAKVLVQGAQ